MRLKNVISTSIDVNPNILKMKFVTLCILLRCKWLSFRTTYRTTKLLIIIYDKINIILKLNAVAGRLVRGAF